MGEKKVDKISRGYKEIDKQVKTDVGGKNIDFYLITSSQSHWIQM